MFLRRWFARDKDNRQRSQLAANWLSALNAAAAVSRRAVVSEADVLQAVSHELRSLGLVGGVLLLDSEGKLVVRSRMLSPVAEGTLRRLTGLNITGFELDPESAPSFGNVLKQGKAAFVANRTLTLREVVPQRFKAMLPLILRMIGGESPTIIAPLIVFEHAMGVITVNARWLTEEDVAPVSALADHVAIAIGHVRAREEMQAALERERLRNQVAETVASALDLPTVLERVIQVAVQVTGADAGSFGLLDRESQVITYPSLFNIPATAVTDPAPRGTGLAWDLIDTGNPILLDEYGDHPQALKSWAKGGLHAFLGVPLYAGDEPIGALGLFKTRWGDTFRPDQVEMAQALANMSAIAIRNAQLYAETHLRAEESQALIRTSRSISASLDLETVLKLIVEQAKDLFDADGSRIHMLDPDRNALRCLVALDPQASEFMALELEPGAGLAGHVLQTAQPMIINDPSSDPRSLQVPGTPDDERECLALAPLVARQRPVGVMAVRRFGLDRPFKAADIDLLTAFAAQAAVAIENADLYGQIESQAQVLEVQVVERTRDLELSEARYLGLLETSLAGIAHIDVHGVLTYVNQVFSELVAFPASELRGMHISEAVDHIFPEDLRETMLQRLRSRPKHGLPAREIYEVDIRGAGARRVPTIMAVNRIQDEEGQAQGATVVVLDISARKTLETALRSERDRLDTILTSIGDAVIVASPDGQIEYANPAWERLSGFTRKQALAKAVGLVDEDLNPSVSGEMWETLRAGSPWHGELLNRRKDSSTFEVAVTITPVLDEDGKVVNYVAVEHDISALKELDRLKSQFVSDVSHELRTPLTNIRLYVDLLRETRDIAKASAYVETLTRESERLAHLIDDLLSLSRLESGATPFQPRPVDVNEILEALYSDRRALAAKKGLVLLLESTSDLPTAMGDERLLTQVFTNLLTNAMNYTPSGGRITLKTDERTRGQRNWITAVFEDTGIGIAPEERPMIFQRFFRGKASHDTGAPGTGLGLSICKEIAEIHGGQITVDSNGERGTRVTVWLPATQEDAEAPGAISSRALSSPTKS